MSKIFNQKISHSFYLKANFSFKLFHFSSKTFFRLHYFYFPHYVTLQRNMQLDISKWVLRLPITPLNILLKSFIRGYYVNSSCLRLRHLWELSSCPIITVIHSFINGAWLRYFVICIKLLTAWKYGYTHTILKHNSKWCLLTFQIKKH